MQLVALHDDEYSTRKYYDRGKEVKSSEPSYDKQAAKKPIDDNTHIK